MNSFSKVFFLVMIFSLVIMWNLHSSNTSNVLDKSYFFSSDTIKSIEQDSVKAEDLTKGKVLYRSKCQKCHTLYKPKDFTLKVWKKNLKEMRWKAELNEDEYKLIFLYLTANSKK